MDIVNVPDNGDLISPVVFQQSLRFFPALKNRSQRFQHFSDLMWIHKKRAGRFLSPGPV
jgi:hypothetical protein